MRALLILLGILALGGDISAQTITTIAGGREEGYEPFALTIGQPLANISTLGSSIAMDSHGRIYFGTDFSRLWRIDETTLTLDLIAGNGINLDAGDGGAANNATISSILSLAIDGSDNIYLSVSNDRIRRISASGTITTYAGTGTAGFSGDGGLATSAQITDANALATDHLGNLFFYDGTFRIRRVDASTKIITTVAGNGVSGYSGDGGLAINASFGSRIDIDCDPDGNLIITDAHRIRKIDLGSGVVSTIAGNGVAGFAGDGGPASAAQMNLAISLDVDATGNIFFLDANNYRVRKIDASSGNITTLAGNGNLGELGSFNGEGGPASSASLRTGQPPQGSGLICVADNGDIVFQGLLRLNRITASGTYKQLYGTPFYYGDDVPATEASLSSPSGICIEAGQLYIGDQASFRIRKVDLQTNTITNFGGIGQSSSVGDGGNVGSAGFSNLFIIRSDGDGNLFVVDFGNNAIRRVDKVTGIVTTYAGTLGVAGFSGDGGPANAAKLSLPTAIAFDKDWNLYIADRGNARIRKVDKQTGTISTIAGNGVSGFGGDGGPAINASFNQISHLTFDTNGDLFISDRLNNRVRKIDQGTGIVTTVVGNGTTTYPGDGFGPLQVGIDFPYGIAFDASGDMYIAAANLNRILKLSNTSGKLTTFAGTGVPGNSGDGGSAANAKINFPRDLIIDDNGAVIFADNGNGRIRKIEPVITGDLLPSQVNLDGPTLFPNPTSGTLFLKIPQGNPENEVSSFEVVDITGRIQLIIPEFVNDWITLDVSSLNSGLYLLRIGSPGKAPQVIRFAKSK